MSQATKKKTETGNKPVKVFRIKGVKVSIWANSVTIDGRETIMHKVTDQRIYREGDDWKTTESYSRDDLPILQMLVQDAYRWILEVEAAKNREEAAA